MEGQKRDCRGGGSKGGAEEGVGREGPPSPGVTASFFPAAFPFLSPVPLSHLAQPQGKPQTHITVFPPVHIYPPDVI